MLLVTGSKNYTELAKWLKVSNQSISQFKQRGVPKKRLREIASRSGCSVQWLEYGEGISKGMAIKEPEIKYGMPNLRKFMKNNEKFSFIDAMEEQNRQLSYKLAKSIYEMFKNMKSDKEITIENIQRQLQASMGYAEAPKIVESEVPITKPFEDAEAKEIVWKYVKELMANPKNKTITISRDALERKIGRHFLWKK